MAFEKIEAPEPAVEHPACRAARMIRDLHKENLKVIAEGQIFLKDNVDVTAEIKAACEEQIVACEAIMKRAEHMDPKLWAPSMAILTEAEEVIDAAKKSGDPIACILPEIGDFSHDA